MEIYGFEGVPDTVSGESTVQDFLDSAIIGWDEGIGSYFIVGPEDGDGQPIYWFGPNKSIVSPYALMAVVNSLFGCSQEEFEGIFSDVGTKQLVEERNATVSYPEDFLTIDAYWKENINARV